MKFELALATDSARIKNAVPKMEQERVWRDGHTNSTVRFSLIVSSPVLFEAGRFLFLSFKRKIQACRRWPNKAQSCYYGLQDHKALSSGEPSAHHRMLPKKNRKFGGSPLISFELLFEDTAMIS